MKKITIIILFLLGLIFSVGGFHLKRAGGASFSRGDIGKQYPLDPSRDILVGFSLIGYSAYLSIKDRWKK
ncbi:MAG: hypothetical protein EBX50_22830 [Chitinophagia bacterium]|nr:hypothetical protein [Chitinophagia bacterium]